MFFLLLRFLTLDANIFVISLASTLFYSRQIYYIHKKVHLVYQDEPNITEFSSFSNSATFHENAKCLYLLFHKKQKCLYPLFNKKQKCLYRVFNENTKCLLFHLYKCVIFRFIRSGIQPPFLSAHYCTPCIPDNTFSRSHSALLFYRATVLF